MVGGRWAHNPLPWTGAATVCQLRARPDLDELDEHRRGGGHVLHGQPLAGASGTRAAGEEVRRR